MNSDTSMNGSLNYWLVVDTIRLPDAIEVLKRQYALEHVLPLFANSSFEYALDKSPMVVNLGTERSIALSALSLKGFDSSAVIFEVSGHIQAESLLAHLQSLLLVNINQQPTFLRFYTRVFWDKYASALNDADKNTLLGVAKAVDWMSASHQRCSISRPDGKKVVPPYSLTSSIFIS
ncbi:DUF4123 domain-containing protein [Vibrio parahaemolyticus]|nr:DUF4123 domain-containing protein [Vibrio parahaemolyticus]